MANMEEYLLLSADRMGKLYRRYFWDAVNGYHFAPNEIAVLAFLWKYAPERDTSTDIVQNHGISKALVARSVAALHKRGLLYCERDENDHRLVHLRLNEEGERVARKLSENKQYLFERMREGIPEEELEAVNIILRRMQQNLCALLDDEEHPVT